MVSNTLPECLGYAVVDKHTVKLFGPREGTHRYVQTANRQEPDLDKTNKMACAQSDQSLRCALSG